MDTVGLGLPPLIGYWRQGEIQRLYQLTFEMLTESKDLDIFSRQRERQDFVRDREKEYNLVYQELLSKEIKHLEIVLLLHRTLPEDYAKTQAKSSIQILEEVHAAQMRYAQVKKTCEEDYNHLIKTVVPRAIRWPGTVRPSFRRFGNLRNIRSTPY
jgi:hypothetical protein